MSGSNISRNFKRLQKTINIFNLLKKLHDGRFLFYRLSWLAASPADLTRDPPFDLDDIGGRGEPDASQNTLPTLQLVHLQHGAGSLQLPLCRLDISCNLPYTHTHVTTLAPDYAWPSQVPWWKRIIDIVRYIKDTIWEAYDPRYKIRQILKFYEEDVWLCS